MAEFGALERAIMEVLWAAGEPLTVRQVHERLATEKDVAYTTAMTVLDRLAKKKILTQEKADRAYRYSPVQTRDELTASLMLDALSSLDGAAREAALVHFVGGVGQDGAKALKAALEAAERRR